MQELFSQLEIEHPNLFNTHTQEGRKFINDYYKFFEMEKQQIIDAWENGYEHGACVNKDKAKYYGIQYYKETFKLT